MGKEINGRLLAKRMLNQLQKRVGVLKRKGVVPYLAIFSAGDDPASASFIREKKRAAKITGANLKHFKFRKEASYQEFAESLNRAAKDPQFSGIIIQKPLPVSLAHASLDLIIPLKKDVDGVNPKSPFIPPVAMAVLKVLDFIRRGEVKETFTQERSPSEGLISERKNERSAFINWLTHHSILLIGRGETAGKPIAKTFTQKRVRFLIAHQETENLARFAKKADIVISCVGKGVVKKEMLKEGAILIGVGVRKDKRGRIKGDFEEKEIKDVVSFYTPTPGGVGPLTVACLMENLVKACETDRL